MDALNMDGMEFLRDLERLTGNCDTHYINIDKNRNNPDFCFIQIEKYLHICVTLYFFATPF